MDAIVIATLGIMGTMVGVLVWLIKKQFDQNDTNTKESNTTNRSLAASINRLSVASEKQIEATQESRDENRRFQERVINKLDTIDEKADRNFTAIKTQTIKTQTVEHQTSKEVTTQGGEHETISK